MAHSDTWEGKWRRNWQMEWIASTLHTTLERGVSSITTADAHTSAASNRLNWRPCRFKWTHPFRWKTNSDFCACAITFQMQSTFSCHAFFEWRMIIELSDICKFVCWDVVYLLLSLGIRFQNLRNKLREGTRQHNQQY